MKATVNTAVSLLVAAGWLQLVRGTYYPDVYYLTNYCNTTLMVQSDSRIRLSPSTLLSTPRTCLLTLAPLQPSTLLIAKFRSYSISFSYSSDNDYCPFVALQLYNNDRIPLLNSYLNFCGSRKPTGNYYLGPSGQFRLTTGRSYVTAPSMDLLVTQVITKGEASSCPYNYFDCKNTYCIPDSVTCNGYDDCGNDRDEIEGCGLTPGIIVGVVAGIGFFIFLVVVFILVFRRYRRRVTYVQYY